MISETFVELGLALGLGLLVGLQREQAGSALGGIRTFSLISLLGATSALLSQALGPFVVAAGILAVAALAVAAHFTHRDRSGGTGGTGQTTEVAAVLMYAIGAYVVLGDRGAAVALGGALSLLLYLKQPLHNFVRGLETRDTTAIFRFVLISLVILPVLPDRKFGPPPYDVFNPRSTWLLVVLIVGISLAGYVAQKALGKQAGAILGGTAGGLVSSTATTASFARRSREGGGGVLLPGLVILIATVVSTARVTVLAAALAREHWTTLVPPLAVVLAAMAVLAAVTWIWVRNEPADMPEQSNPAEIGPAVLFGAIYVVVLLGVSVARQYFGNRGLFAVAAVSGLTDLDAITLSTAKLIREGQIVADVGWRVIVVGIIANLIFKAGTVFALGTRKLAWLVAALFGGSALAAVGVLVFWPKG